MANSYASFDGLTGYITVPDNDALDAGTNDLSVAGWFDTFTNGKTLLFKGDVFPFKGYHLYIGSGFQDIGKLVFRFCDGVSAAITLMATKPSDGWHHIAASIDRNGSGVLYVDSVAVDTESAITTNQLSLSTSANLLIGYSDTGTNYDGNADDIRIYNDTALTADQAAALYRGGQGTRLAGTPIPSWRSGFDVVSGATIQGIKADGFELNGTKSSGVTLVSGGVPFASSSPTGYLGLAMSYFKNLLAESPTLWDGLGLTGDDGDNTEAAKLSIYLTTYDVSAGTVTRPFLLIARVGADKAESMAFGTAAVFNQNGSFELRIERGIPAGYQSSGADAEADFMNFVDGILDDMMSLSGLPGYFIVSGWEIIDGPFQFAEDRSEEYVYGIRIKINWGLQ